MGIEEVDGKDKSNSEQGFITMDDLGDIDEPARKKLGEENREPEYQATESIMATPQKTAR